MIILFWYLLLPNTPPSPQIRHNLVAWNNQFGFAGDLVGQGLEQGVKGMVCLCSVGLGPLQGPSGDCRWPCVCSVGPSGQLGFIVLVSILHILSEEAS